MTAIHANESFPDDIRHLPQAEQSELVTSTAPVLATRSRDITGLPQAALIVGISQSAAYELAAQGKFPGAVRVGHRWRVSIPVLMRHLHGDLAGQVSA